MELKDYISWIITLVGIFGLGGLALYTRYILKANQNNITKSFEETVSKLSSNSTSEMYSSAILLRRYFDKTSSFGVGGAPLAKDTISVIASMLKIENIDSGLQKILADSLKEAPDLIKADLQEVNLYKAVLGKKNLNMSGADFYNADLSEASFKDKDSENEGVILKGAVFRGALLYGTNFTGADLEGANFKKAKFKNTNFTNCKNKPAEVVAYLDSSTRPRNKTIFISHPNPTRQTMEQQVVYNSIIENLKRCDINIIELLYTADRRERLSRFISNIEDSDGMLVFDFKRLKITKGEYLSEEAQNPKEVFGHVSSRWVYLEAGMGLMHKLPTYVITDLTDSECIFNGIIGKDIVKIENYKKNNLTILNTKINNWIDRIST